MCARPGQKVGLGRSTVRDGHRSLMTNRLKSQIENPDFRAPQSKQDPGSFDSARHIQDLLTSYVADQLMPFLEMKKLRLQQLAVSLDDFGSNDKTPPQSLAIKAVVPILVVGSLFCAHCSYTRQLSRGAQVLPVCSRKVWIMNVDDRFADVIVTVVGARPNFMKAAPIHRAFHAAGIENAICHTGQHYDAAMSRIFFEELGMPRPIVDLEVGSGTHAEQTAAIMLGVERFFTHRRPRAVLVVGDVNSTMAAAIVAAKMGLYSAHVEAGLRSGDWTMPEEVNRVVTDAVVDLLLTPSEDADQNLLAEGCPPETIVRVGNVMIDALKQHLPAARALDIPGRMGLKPRQYVVLTLHRPSNVDDPSVLSRIMGAVAQIARRLPVVFPVHPRTRRQAAAAGIGPQLEETPGLVLTDPLGYLEFLSLSSEARLVLTDSGGLQEESTVLGIPCLTLRDNTERPITVTQGTNVLVGSNPQAIVREAERALDREAGARHAIPELWDGRASERIVAAVLERLP